MGWDVAQRSSTCQAWTKCPSCPGTSFREIALGFLILCVVEHKIYELKNGNINWLSMSALHCPKNWTPLVIVFTICI